MSLNSPDRFMVSVISDNPRYFFSNLQLFEEARIRGLHFDVMDGIFVPRLGLHPEILQEIRRLSNMYIEVHTMLQLPSKYLDLFASLGANRILFHVETEDDLKTAITTARAGGMEVGLVVNPLTPISHVTPHLYEIDAVMLMAINPGIPKHPFIDETFNRLIELRQLVDIHAPHIEISIDGGVTFSNYLKLLQGGADTLICGSGTVFHPEGSIKENLARLIR